MPAKTHLFLCLKDNYGVLLHDPESGATAAIDAPEAAPVEAALKTTGWRLTDILVTHHHHDHTGGIAELKQRHRCRVVAPHGEAARIPLVDETVRENDKARVGGLEARVIETPGHTAGHIAYVFAADKLAFVGDTLFSIGCGRVIEGNARDDVAVAAEAARAAGRHPHLLRSRIHAGEYPVRPHGRAGQQGAARRARRRSSSCSPRTSRRSRRPWARKRPPIRSCAPISPKSPPQVGLAGKPASQVFAEIRERKNNF